MSISSERKQFISDIAEDDWVDRVDDDEYDRVEAEMELARQKFVQTVKDPEELHLFAD